MEIEKSNLIEESKQYLESLGVNIPPKIIVSNVNLSSEEVRRTDMYIRDIVNRVSSIEGTEEALLFEKELKGELGTYIPNRHSNPSGRINYNPDRCRLFYSTYIKYLEGMEKPLLKAFLVDDLQVLTEQQFNKLF